MAAKLGNQFWRNRSKHGRDRLFETPELLLEACQEYFNWTDSKPYYKVEVLKGGDSAGKLVKVPNMQPYTIQGLCIYLGCNTLWFNQFERSLVGKDDDTSKGFSTILTHVREIIYHQKFVGASVGAFNASIIQRDLGLRDNSNVELKNPEGETFRTTNTHEVVFKRFTDKPTDDNQSNVQ